MRELAMAAVVMAVLALGACGGGGSADGGRIQIDGSSTVYAVSQALAEEYMMSEAGRDVRVTVAQSGTGGGFQRFCAGQTAIADASRPIHADERAMCEANGVEPLRFEIAKDGITAVVNPANEFVDCLTVAELRAIWGPGSVVQTWSDVRSEWPNQEIKLYGPGPESGTFDYFTAAVIGEEGASRQDYTASEDDNVLVQGVAGDPGALGYFGFAYYERNADQLEAVALDAAAGCVMPSRETIASGEYLPLSRSVYIYVSGSALGRPEVRDFVRFYMENARELVPAAGYVPLADSAYAANLARVAGRDD